MVGSLGLCCDFRHRYNIQTQKLSIIIYNSLMRSDDRTHINLQILLHRIHLADWFTCIAFILQIHLQRHIFCRLTCIVYWLLIFRRFTCDGSYELRRAWRTHQFLSPMCFLLEGEWCNIMLHVIYFFCFIVMNTKTTTYTIHIHNNITLWSP